MKKILLAVVLMAGATFSRLVPHVPDWTAVLAVALFAGAYFDGALATVTAIGSLAIGDAIIGYYQPGLMGFDYGAIILVMVVGMALTMNGKKRIGGKRIIPASLAGSLAGSILFFAISNFGVWATSGWYPPTWSGLVACYIGAIPFFTNTLLSTAAFSFILFASYEVALKAIRGRELTKGIIYN